MPQLGLWVEAPTSLVAREVDVEVVSPVPWCPPLPSVGPLGDVVKFRRVPPSQVRDGVRVHHPRYLAGPGYRLHRYEADLLARATTRLVTRLHRRRPFDLIHAHFTYPEGVAADRIAQTLGLPLVVTEHAPWRPWFERYPSVAAQTVPVARRVSRHLAVSRRVAEDIRSYTGETGDRVTVVPVGVDESRFLPCPPDERDPDRILFVGLPRPAKGVDVLLEALAMILPRRPATRLTVVGGAIYRGAQAHVADLRRRADQPDLAGRVEFTGILPPEDVASLMARSALLVLPSRLESFGAVLVEALASGTPVVTTRSGGPEEIVGPDLGRVVPVEDPPALAEAMMEVLDDPSAFPAQRLRDHALGTYTWSAVATRLLAEYSRATG